MRAACHAYFILGLITLIIFRETYKEVKHFNLTSTDQRSVLEHFVGECM